MASYHYHAWLQGCKQTQEAFLQSSACEQTWDNRNFDLATRVRTAPQGALIMMYANKVPAPTFGNFNSSQLTQATTTCYKSLQHDQCNSEQPRATHTTHATNKHMQHHKNNAIEVARKCNNVCGETNPLQMHTGFHAPTHSVHTLCSTITL